MTAVLTGSKEGMCSLAIFSVAWLHCQQLQHGGVANGSEQRDVNAIGSTNHVENDILKMCLSCERTVIIDQIAQSQVRWRCNLLRPR